MQVAPRDGQDFAHEDETGDAEREDVRCSYSEECAYYKEESPYCAEQPARCPKWREIAKSQKEVSDFSDDLFEAASLTKAVHVVTPYGKFEHDLNNYDFEVVGEELVVYPINGSRGSFHYRGSFLYYVEREYKK